jgi:hypothetical protein
LGRDFAVGKRSDIQAASAPRTGLPGADLRHMKRSAGGQVLGLRLTPQPTGIGLKSVKSRSPVDFRWDLITVCCYDQC